jgi:hypothetical protein
MNENYMYCHFLSIHLFTPLKLDSITKYLDNTAIKVYVIPVYKNIHDCTIAAFGWGSGITGCRLLFLWPYIDNIVQINV